jgi:molybdopterin converting factor small subunit
MAITSISLFKSTIVISLLITSYFCSYDINQTSKSESETIHINSLSEITDEDLFNMLNKKEENMFVYGYSKINDANKEHIANAKEILSQMDEIILITSASPIPIYFLNIQKYPTITLNIGELNPQGYLFSYFNRGSIFTYEDVFSFDEVSNWIISKYLLEERKEIHNAIRNQFKVEKDELTKDNDEVNDEETNKNSRERKSQDESCEESPLKLVQGGIDLLNKQIDKLELEFKEYQKQLAQNAYDMKKLSDNMSQVKPIQVLIFIFCLLILIAAVLTYKRMNRKKKPISII